MTLELAILKSFTPGTYRAEVQLISSLTTYLDAIPVSVAIAQSALSVGNRVLVAIPGGHVKDAVVIATWPGGTPPSAGATTFLGLTDTPSSYSGQEANFPKVAAGEAALDFGLIYDILFGSRFLQPWVANWTTLTTGSGSATQQGYRIYLATGSTSGSTAAFHIMYSGYVVSAANEPAFEADFVQSSSSSIELAFGLNLATDPYDLNGGFGIDVLGSAIRAYSADGARSVLDLSTSVTTGTYMTVKQRLVGGAIKTWINGVAKTDKTTNVPTTQNIYRFVGKIKNTAASNKTLGIIVPKIAWKP